MGVQYSISSIYNVTGDAYNSSAKTGSITQPSNGAGGTFTTHRLTNTNTINKWSYAEAEFAITPPSSPDIYKDITIKYRYKYVNDVSGNWQNPTVKLGHKDASGNKIYGTYTHGGDKSLSSGSWTSWYTETLAPPLNSSQYRLIMHIKNNQNLTALLGVTVEIEYIDINYTPHTHSWGTTTYSWSSDGKSCTATRTCNVSGCGTKETSTATITSAVKTAATCLAKGTTTYTAKFSDSWATTQTKDVQDIAQKSHSYTGAVKSNGNGKDATHSFKCVNGCNNYGNATKHTWNSGSVTTQPTCTASGVKTYTCTASGCGATYTESVSAKGHTEVTIPAVAPTCNTTGSTEGKTCSVCNTILTAPQTIPALGHTITVKSNNDSYGTVTGGGHYDCGKTATLTATPKTGYTFVKWNDNVTTNPRTITVTADTTYTATFEVNTVIYRSTKKQIVYKGTKGVGKVAIYKSTKKIYG